MAERYNMDSSLVDKDWIMEMKCAHCSKDMIMSVDNGVTKFTCPDLVKK